MQVQDILSFLLMSGRFVGLHYQCNMLPNLILLMMRERDVNLQCCQISKIELSSIFMNRGAVA